MKIHIVAALLLISAAASAAGDAAPSKALPPGHPSVGAPIDLGSIRVTKASGPDARTVEEIIAQRAELKDKPVVLHGKVVKFRDGIMGKNWVHLRDGTGSDAKENNDILVTTQDLANPGDVVTVRGTVRTDKDFGSGYAYDVLIEEASITPDKPAGKPKK